MSDQTIIAEMERLLWLAQEKINRYEAALKEIADKYPGSDGRSRQMVAMAQAALSYNTTQGES